MVNYFISEENISDSVSDDRGIGVKTLIVTIFFMLLVMSLAGIYILNETIDEVRTAQEREIQTDHYYVIESMLNQELINLSTAEIKWHMLPYQQMLKGGMRVRQRHHFSPCEGDCVPDSQKTTVVLSRESPRINLSDSLGSSIGSSSHYKNSSTNWMYSLRGRSGGREIEMTLEVSPF